MSQIKAGAICASSITLVRLNFANTSNAATPTLPIGATLARWTRAHGASIIHARSIAMCARPTRVYFVRLPGITAESRGASTEESASCARTTATGMSESTPRTAHSRCRDPLPRGLSSPRDYHTDSLAPKAESVAFMAFPLLSFAIPASGTYGRHYFLVLSSHYRHSFCLVSSQVTHSCSPLLWMSGLHHRWSPLDLDLVLGEATRLLTRYPCSAVYTMKQITKRYTNQVALSSICCVVSTVHQHEQGDRNHDTDTVPRHTHSRTSSKHRREDLLFSLYPRQ